jgi:hypothetical protein
MNLTSNIIMMPSPYILIVSFLALLFLYGCRETELKRMPDTFPDIKGKIISLSNSDEEKDRATLTIVVKAMEGMDVKVTEANIKVTEETLIKTKSGRKLSAEMLQQGQEIEVWLGPQIMESFPVQATAIAIRLPD